MTHVDGNAVIGALSLAIGTDASGAVLVCSSCGADHAVAEAHVYLRCPGIVIRCPGCASAEIVLVEIDHRFLVTVGNVANIHFGAG